MGFVQVRLEVVAIVSSSITAFVRACPITPHISSKYLTLAKAKQWLRAKGILMTHLTQSPNLSGHCT